MAKIPTFDSTRQLTTRAPIVRRDVGAAGERGRSLQLIGEATQKISAMFLEAQALNETTKASTEASRQLNELQLEATTDPDIWNSQKYQDKISKVRDSASKLISLPSARNKFNRAFDRDAIAADFNIRSTLRKRQIDESKADMLANIDAMKDSYINASSPQEQQVLETKRDLLIESNVALGVIDKEAAFNLKKKAVKEWQETDIRNTIALDADLAEDMLIKGDFKDLTADETAKWLEVARQKIERNKKEADKALDERWLKNGGNVIENLEATSVQNLIELITAGEIDPEFGSDLVKWKTDPDSVSYETDKTIWLEIARDSVSPEQDLRAFQKRIGKAIADGHIQVDDAANLSVQVKALFDTAIKFKSRPSRLHQAVGVAMDFFKSFARFQGLDLTEAPYEMINNLLNMVSNNNLTTPEQIKEASENIANEKVREIQPSTEILKDIPNGVISQDGDLNISNVNNVQIKPTHKWVNGKLIKVD